MCTLLYVLCIQVFPILAVGVCTCSAPHTRVSCSVYIPVMYVYVCTRTDVCEDVGY